MINLREYELMTFDLTLKDGRILNVLQPSKKLYEDLDKMGRIAQANDESEKSISMIYNFVTRIFNRNINDITLTQEEVEQLGIKTLMFVILEFQSWVTDIKKN